ncbi:MAG: TRAP transporter substrate-binding protein [Bilophila wadsworthia]
MQVFPNSQLGKEDAYIASTRKGIIQMCATGTQTSAIQPSMAMLETPMLFDDYAHARRAMNGGKTFELITNGFTEKSGMRVLNAFPLGFRHFYTKKPVATIDDMKHLRMRVPNIPLYINFAKECGISGQPMPFAEVTGALDQGVIDGGDSPLSDIVSIKMYETTPEITLTGHLLVIHSLYINEKFYQSLPEQDKKWIDEAAKRSADYVWDLWKRSMRRREDHHRSRRPYSRTFPRTASSCRTPASAAGSFSMTPSRMPRKSLTARTLIVRRSNVCVLNRASGAGRRPFFSLKPMSVAWARPSRPGVHHEQ